ncbi:MULTISPECIES: hypothetical protein [Phenylobacterium]|uniref:Phosphate starvation-inducible protein PsiF n=1 Tax=Phenylobacterium koreense TaxID=266125 RepID=A0ABV2EEA6_9CAUL
MRNLVAPAALVLSLALGSAALAATPASAPAKPAPATTKASMATKRAACEKSWASQKSHTGDKAAFVKACVAKG